MKKPYIPALVILALVIIALAVWATAGYQGSSGVPTAVTPTPIATSTPITASSTPAANTYTLAQIAQHSTATSCWLAIDGNVYDVTTFIPIHPGGRAILRGCGKDASALFHSVPTHAAQNVENTVAPQYKIGTLAQ